MGVWEPCTSSAAFPVAVTLCANSVASSNSAQNVEAMTASPYRRL